MPTSTSALPSRSGLPLCRSAAAPELSASSAQVYHHPWSLQSRPVAGADRASPLTGAPRATTAAGSASPLLRHLPRHHSPHHAVTSGSEAIARLLVLSGSRLPSLVGLLPCRFIAREVVFLLPPILAGRGSTESFCPPTLLEKGSAVDHLQNRLAPLCNVVLDGVEPGGGQDVGGFGVDPCPSNLV